MNHTLPLVSIIIVDYKKKNPYLLECLEAIEKQSYRHFEIILVCDYHLNLSSSRPVRRGGMRGSIPTFTQKSFGHYVGPAQKRDIGAKMAKGEILAFIDDDAYPSPDWLKSLVPHFKDASIAGVGGPGVTPPNVSWQETSSGWASASPIGSGPHLYRFLASRKRLIEDYPSMNLAVRKADFDRVGGFDSNFWPGEDTKLCLDLTHKLSKKIIYDPKVLVFHHRRPIWKDHLKQNGNFGLHRGFFARILPQTSLKFIYFLPSLLLLGLIFLVLCLSLSFPTCLPAGMARSGIYTNLPVLSSVRTIGLYSFALYFFMLFLNSLWIAGVSKNIFQAALSIPVIFITHLWYGARFLQGFLFTKKLAR